MTFPESEDAPELREGDANPPVPSTLPPRAEIDVVEPAATVSALPLETSPTLAADARSPLGWYDLFYLALFYLGAGIFLMLIVSGVAILAFGVSPAVLRQSIREQAPLLIITQALLSGATLAFLYVMVRGRTSAPFWPAVGWRTFGKETSTASTIGRYVLGGFGLALLIGILGRFVGGSSPVPLEEMFRSRQSVLLLMALGILVAPVVEETIFRGCIYPVIARKFGISAGVLVTGTLFGLAHAQQLGGAWGQISLLILVGIILTYVRARAGTVAASYVVHLAYNSILFAGFYMATGGLRHLPGS